VNNEGKGLITIFDEDGTKLGDWGNGTGSAAGQLTSADGLAYDSYRHRLAVADQLNYRIQVFDWYEALVETGLYNSTIDTTAPTLSQQIDIVLEEGGSDTLSWTISDTGLSWDYVIELDDEAVQSGYWKNGGIISFDLPISLFTRI